MLIDISTGHIYSLGLYIQSTQIQLREAVGWNSFSSIFLPLHGYVVVIYIWYSDIREQDIQPQNLYLQRDEEMLIALQERGPEQGREQHFNQQGRVKKADSCKVKWTVSVFIRNYKRMTY